MKLRGTVLLMVVVLGSAGVTFADVVTDWNAAALQAIRDSNTSPPPASRNLAMLHGAIYDAVNGILRTHEPYLATGRAPAIASVEAAASAAARDVLVALYPVYQSTFDQLHAMILGKIPDGLRKDQGTIWGSRVAAQMLAARANDGSTETIPWPGSEEPGQWRPTVSFGGVVRPALLPLWGQVTPFALNSGSEFRPPAPPALNTREYAAEVNQVQALGKLDSEWRTAEQTEIARFWGYGPGTATPPGHWNQVAQAVAASEGNSLPDNARMFALLNLALADAAIVSWDAKYTFNFWRPITAIPLADTDGNPLTSPDPAWMPLLETPPFPEYTSGHSTFSGAAAVALGFFYGRDHVKFSVGSDDLPGVFRKYKGFWDAALESGMSRILGGIHFMSANVYGLMTGAKTGAYVSFNYLLPRP